MISDQELVKSIDLFITNSITQWQQLHVEIQSTKSLLQKILESWQLYSSCVDELNKWLLIAEKSLLEGPQNRQVGEQLIDTFFQEQNCLLCKLYKLILSPNG